MLYCRHMADRTVAGTKRCVVVIDDERKILDILRNSLSRDYCVTAYDHPTQALHALRSGDVRPDLILCDVMMPELNGFELHAKLRELPTLTSIPFMYLTALDDRAYFRKGMLAGADDYITKPFSPEELRTTIAKRLERVDNLQKHDGENEALRIESLGGFRASLGRERINWTVKKAVVAFLYFLEHDEPVALDKVKRDLWRDDVADNTLHVLNLRLRKVINDFAELIVEQRRARLNVQPQIVWDVPHFRQVAQEGITKRDYAVLERAINLYKGEFMPTFDVPWAERQRNRLESTFMELLELSIQVAPESERERAQQRLESYFNH